MRPWTRPRFLIVVLGEGLSMLGDGAFALALAWIVLSNTGSVAALTGVMLAQSVPHGLLLLLGGAVTDRISPRRVMALCHVVRAVAMALLGVLVLADRDELWHFYAIAALVGAAAAFFNPAAESVLPHLLPTDEYAAGNAVQGFAVQGAYLLGPLVGAALMSVGGAGAAITTNAASFALASLTVRAVPRSGPDAATRPMLDELRAGLAHARASSELRIVLLIIAAATLSYSGVFAVGLPVLARTLTSSPVGLAIMLSSWGAGQLLGTVVAAVVGLPRHWGRLVIAMTLAETVSFVSLGVVDALWAVAAILLLLGTGVAFTADVALPTFVQTRTERRLLGRVSAVLALPQVLLQPVSVAVLGAALAWSVPWGFALAAVPMLALGVRLVLDPMVRHLTIEPPENTTSQG